MLAEASRCARSIEVDQPEKASELNAQICMGDRPLGRIT